MTHVRTAAAASLLATVLAVPASAATPTPQAVVDRAVKAVGALGDPERGHAGPLGRHGLGPGRRQAGRTAPDAAHGERHGQRQAVPGPPPVLPQGKGRCCNNRGGGLVGRFPGVAAHRHLRARVFLLALDDGAVDDRGIARRLPGAGRRVSPGRRITKLAYEVNPADPTLFVNPKKLEALDQGDLPEMPKR